MSVSRRDFLESSLKLSAAGIALGNFGLMGELLASVRSKELFLLTVTLAQRDPKTNYPYALVIIDPTNLGLRLIPVPVMAHQVFPHASKPETYLLTPKWKKEACEVDVTGSRQPITFAGHSDGQFWGHG